MVKNREKREPTFKESIFALSLVILVILITSVINGKIFRKA